MGIPNNY